MNFLPSRASPTHTSLALLLLSALAACDGSSSVVAPASDASSADVADASRADSAVDVANDLADVTDTADAQDVRDAPDAPTGCRSSADCASDPGGPVCDTASGRCVRCLAASDMCPSAQHCDPMTNVCVDGCRTDEGCTVAGADAGTVGDGSTDGGVPLRVCDPAAHRCVQCRGDDHCPSGMLCVGQVCVMGCTATRPCPGTQACCSGACVDTQTNTAACGACGRACVIPNGTPSCVGGACVVSTCTGTFADCNGDAADGCETDVRSSATHCGMCGRACTFPNAMGACAEGTCAITSCATGFADCDANPANGCETDLRVSPAHCGMCGRACAFPNAVAGCSDGMCRLGACNPGFADCDMNPANGCETSVSTTDNCGACGRSCSFANASASCTDGACTLGACREGFADCDMNPATGCESDLRTDVSHCATCGRVCTAPNATSECVMGTCGVRACATNFADCDGAPGNGCEINTSTDAAHCNGCGRACRFPNAAGVCAAGACRLGACATGFADCDGEPGNGCETNLQTSTTDCGRCDNACVFAGATASCVAGVCRPTMCLEGRGDCDGTPSNGCETDINSSLGHCGACGNACVIAGGTARCTAGACSVAACSAGFADCNMRVADGCEVDTRSDPLNCSACGGACALSNAVSACALSTCQIAACRGSFGDCNTRDSDGCEVDLATSVTHCGACGRACVFPNAAATCAMGVCAMGACASGFADCNLSASDGCEVDLRSSVSHCGACGRACAFTNASALCAAGVCSLGACNTGFADCDGNPANGCETDTRTSANHCGACGRVCTTNRCTASVCDRAGDGADGSLAVRTNATLTPVATPLVTDAAAATNSLRVISTAGFGVDSEVMVIDTQGSDAGHYEFGRVTALTTNTLTIAPNLTAGFRSADRVQVVRVLRYSDLTLDAAVTLRVGAWNGTTGGVLPVRVSGTARIAGTLTATGSGFRGGGGDSGGRMCGPGAQGESPAGAGGRLATANGGGGGGGGGGCFCCGGCGMTPGGGGGSYGTAGVAGTGACTHGDSGAVYGDAALVRLFLGAGGGGGGGNCDVASGPGGLGGGAIYLAADTLTLTGAGVVSSGGTQGGSGGGYEGGGAGGAGGAVFLAGRVFTTPTGQVSAAGGGSNVGCAGVGGVGGVGRVRIECATLNTLACPGASGAVSAPAASVGTY